MDELRERLRPLLDALYAGSDESIEALCDRFVRRIEAARTARSPELKALDENTDPDWYKASETVAYVLYADLFSPEAPDGQKINALRENLGYLTDLGVNLIHVLPLLKSSGDAGFAVDDYEQVDPRFGSAEDLRALIGAFHQNGLRIALDFVLNHVSDKHAWAMAAKNDDPHYRNFFLWSDSEEPWPGVPSVFPEFAPGHWDYVEKADRWVWSTFYKRRPAGSEHDRFPFAQWDLNYRNPNVLLGMIDTLLKQANWGVDVFRLDAVPFLWKEQGTSCTSLPQVHTLVKLFRLALQSVAPGAVLLAEANQALEQLVDYFGEGDEVQIAYHFTLMPALWQAVTLGRTESIPEVLTRLPRALDRAHWWVLSEVHDDLSLEMLDEATARELSGYFLAGGALPFRQLEAEDFPRGISGTSFTLLRRDPRRLRLLWELKLSLGWTPLFYMGEELGVENDLGFRDDPERREDSRFVKRVALGEDRKNRRGEAGSTEAHLFHSLSGLIAWRKQHTCLAQPPDFFQTGSPAVLGFSKQDAHERLVILANCSEAQQTVTIPGLGVKILKPFEFWCDAG